MLEVASQMASAMDCYEDMFKEITRKLYGEEEDVDFESEGFKSVEHLTAAFGLATRSHLKSETPSVVQPKTSPVTEPQESPTTAAAPTPPTTVSAKRYNCAHCPYATDRRDLFTRHENIHREDKPFQCYVCMKQFNRADHVKKHFLRMHREHTYDLNRIRKQPPKNASGMSFYHKYNESQTPGTTTNLQTQNLQNTQQQINIPTGIVNSMTPRVGATTTQTTTFKTELEPINNTTKTTTTKSSNSKSSSSSNKKKGEKKFSCCYCTWTGVDNWCLKRHLNTHLKPFVCILCDYKAARSERLTTHILKVHNKRACTRCNFLADDQAALTLHIQENHPLDHRNNRNVHNRNSHNSSNSTNNSSTLTPISSTFGQLDTLKSCSKTNEGQTSRPENPKKRQTHGADRLFSYFEASDHDSNPEDETTSNKPPTQQLQPPPTQNVSRPSFPPDKIPNPHQNLPQFKPQDPKKMGDFSKMFFNNQFLGDGSKYMHDPTLMKNMPVNYFSEQNLVFNKFLDEEKNLYYPNLPDSKNMFLNHHNFGAPTPNPFFTPPYIDKAKSAALMNHPTVNDVAKMYKHPDFFKAGNVMTQDDKNISSTTIQLPLLKCTICDCEFLDNSSLVNHIIACHTFNNMISCRTFPAKKLSDDQNKENKLKRTYNHGKKIYKNHLTTTDTNDFTVNLLKKFKSFSHNNNENNILDNLSKNYNKFFNMVF